MKLLKGFTRGMLVFLSLALTSLYGVTKDDLDNLEGVPVFVKLNNKAGGMGQVPVEAQIYNHISASKVDPDLKSMLEGVGNQGGFSFRGLGFFNETMFKIFVNNKERDSFYLTNDASLNSLDRLYFRHSANDLLNPNALLHIYKITYAIREVSMQVAYDRMMMGNNPVSMRHQVPAMYVEITITKETVPFYEMDKLRHKYPDYHPNNVDSLYR